MLLKGKLAADKLTETAKDDIAILNGKGIFPKLAVLRVGAREDDLSFFLECDAQDLYKAADAIRKHFVGDKVDLCSIINGRSGRS